MGAEVESSLFVFGMGICEESERAVVESGPVRFVAGDEVRTFLGPRLCELVFGSLCLLVHPSLERESCEETGTGDRGVELFRSVVVCIFDCVEDVFVAVVDVEESRGETVALELEETVEDDVVGDDAGADEVCEEREDGLVVARAKVEEDLVDDGLLGSDTLGRG